MASSKSSTGSILLLGIPPKTFVGIDLISFDTSPNFHGIINLPSGFHCLYSGTDATLSIRHCHWLKFEVIPGDIQTHTLQWMSEVESLSLLRPSSNVAKTAVGSITSLKGRGLVDYVALQDASSGLRAKQATTSSFSASTGAEAWSTLTRHISSHTLDRILMPSEPNDHNWWSLSSISSAPNDIEHIPGLTTEEASGVLHDDQVTMLNFIPINLKQTWPDGSVGTDRTEKARDRSWYLGHLIDSLTPANQGEARDRDRQAAAKELLAELQFCFLMVLMLANYSSLEQWRRILGVLLTCKTALEDVQGFFIEVVKVLQAQLERIDDVEGGLFEMRDEAGSAWLRALLKSFSTNVNEVLDGEDINKGLQAELKKLEDWLRETYGWDNDNSLLRRGMMDLEDGERIELQMEGVDEDEETGEYAPVVVEV